MALCPLCRTFIGYHGTSLTQQNTPYTSSVFNHVHQQYDENIAFEARYFRWVPIVISKAEPVKASDDGYRREKHFWESGVEKKEKTFE